MKKNILIDAKSAGFSVVEKASYEDVDLVFDVLHDVFHPHGLDEDGPDPRFLALLVLFMTSVGWTEDEYWDEQRSRSHHCKDCGTSLDHHLDDDPKKDKIPPESKSN